MSLFLPNIPQPNDPLDFSQGQLLTNNQGLDTVFGIDHYKFSDATANKGFHNKITTPAFVDSPPTGLPPVTTTAPIFYAFQDSANLGVIQYSRGPTNAVPTPMTCLQSSAAPTVMLAAAVIPIFDFTGIKQADVELFSFAEGNNTVMGRAFWKWTTIAGPSSFLVGLNPTGIESGLISQATGSVLQLKNNTVSTQNVYWTLRFLSIRT